MTDATDPDLVSSTPAVELRRRQQTLVDRPWTQLHQVHGAVTRVVTAGYEHSGTIGDALASDRPDVVLAVQVADCVPIGIWSGCGAFGVAHMGWRGAMAGIVASACRAISQLAVAPQPSLQAVIGSCICADCYEFGADDLASIVERFGPSVASTTPQDGAALDMREVARAALHESGVAVIDVPPACTACGPAMWSHRARQDPQRQVLFGYQVHR